MAGVSRRNSGAPCAAAGTLRDQAAATLRSAILDREYPPGSRLIERELVDRLGVSRATVREVLGDLRSTGLVTLIPQRGAVVTVLDRSEAEDLYEIRYRIETLVVERFVARATDELMSQLEESIDVLVSSARRHAAASELLAHRDAIFAILLRGATSTALWQATEGTRARLDSLRATSIADATRLRESLEEWQGLASALRGRDATLAIAIFGAHLRKAADVALSGLEFDVHT